MSWVKRLNKPITYSFVLLVFICGFFYSEAAALSDKDYKKYLAESPEFRSAEKELNTIWKKLMNTLDPEKKEAVRKDQRQWLKYVRDPRALEIAGKKGLPLAEAYAMAARERTTVLKEILSPNQSASIAGRYSSGMGFLTVRKIPGGMIEFTLTTNWPPQKCSGEIIKAVVKLNGDTAVFSDAECPDLRLIFSRDAVDVLENDFCGYHGMNCNFEGTYTR